jgi:hypothetical protein
VYLEQIHEVTGKVAAADDRNASLFHNFSPKI